MQISEIFYSIQGEGPHIGVPAIFLRLSGCNLRCVWCDSKFTWNMKSGKQMSTKQIIKALKKYPCKHLIITGGEPLLQQSAIRELLEELNSDNSLSTKKSTKSHTYFIEIETSGSIQPQINELINQYNCSPKLSNSKNRQINYQLSLPKFPKEKTWYKFVVDQPSDLGEIKKFIKDHKLPKDKIILIPQGITKIDILKRSKWLAETCKKENWRFSTRLHIEIWGNRRGV